MSLAVADCRQPNGSSRKEPMHGQKSSNLFIAIDNWTWAPTSKNDATRLKHCDSVSEWGM